jgi:acetolactate synthase-1/2/3 large subunit
MKSPTLNGAQIVCRLLERQGVRTVYGIPGGAALPLYDALGQSRLRHVLARHEQGAGFMAQGHARSTGEVGVCLATSGPGATNLLTAIADAKLDSIPLVALTAQVPTALIGTDAFQEVDTLALARPITKAALFAHSVSELLDLIPEAFRLALSGRPGPVLIDIPKDVQLASLAVEDWPQPGRRVPSRAPQAPDLEEALALIARSQRPILYLGGGVIHAGASQLAQALAQRLDSPTVSTLMGLGALPSGHPLFLGMLGMHAAPFTNLALEECDLLIAVGARFDDRATGKLNSFCPGAKVIHADIDARELGKLRQPQAAIHADAADALGALLALLPQQEHSLWRREVERLKAEHPLILDGGDDPRQPYGLIRACARLLPEAVVTTDVGQHQMWAAQAFPLQRPRQWLTSGGLGTMGFGLPAAIGAALADPSRPALCFSGDGSLLMNLQEFATAAELDADVKVVLLDNRSLGLVHQQQDLFYGQRRFASEFQAGPDWARLARAFGWKAWDLGAEADAEAALDEALHSSGPVLLRAPLSAQAKVYPMVAPGGSNKDMLRGPAPGGELSRS